MYAWESIQKVLDSIEDNIAETRSPEELAAVAALSPFYFQRLFTRLVKRPVIEYVRLRRLARACETLADRSRRILDIALDCGFSSHESFTKAFRGAFGITPEEFRANPVHLNQVMKPELLLNYVMVDEGVPLITEDIVIEITRRSLASPESYLGLSATLSVSEATFGEATGVSGPGKLWGEFHRRKSGLASLLPDGVELGASYPSEEEGTFRYFAGAASPSGEPVPDGRTAFELPAGSYVVCQFEAESFGELVDFAINKALKYLLETWLPGHKLSIRPFSAEKYTGITEEASSMELWVLLEE